MNSKRGWWIAGAAIALVIVVVIVVAVTRRPMVNAASDAGSSAPDVPLATARTGVFAEHVTAQGRVGPPAGSGAKIAFAQAGILRSIDARVGGRVHAGDTVAELDRASFAAAVRSATGDAAAAVTAQSAGARLAVANEKLATLERNGPAALTSRIAAQSSARQATLKVEADRATLARDEQLLAAGVIAGKEADAARAQLASDEADLRAADAKVAAAGNDLQTAVKQARADVAAATSDVQTARGQSASAQARLDAARITYANGLLKAPADGTVLAILKHPGEAVDPNSPVIEIGPALGDVVTLTVPGDVARRITTGNPVTVSAVSSRAGVTQGRVSAVVPAIDPATQAATVIVTGAPADAVSGDAVSATIVVGHATGLLVPTGAVVQDPQTGATVVFVYSAHPKPGDSNFAMRPVVIRESDAATSLVASGIRAGERVASQGAYMLLAPAGG